MYDPPHGYDDLSADAETAQFRGDFDKLAVAGIGTIVARRPVPASTAWLALTARPGLSNDDRLGHLHRFVCEHLETGGLDYLLLGMIDGEFPDDTMGRVVRAIATWGTARPYRAVANLAAMTARDWRTIRAHLVNHGIGDPMSLPSMHTLLDVTEALVVESISGDKPAVIKRKRQQFFDALYAPDRSEMVDDFGPKPAPAGFEPDEVEAAFDSFAKVIPLRG